MKVQFPKKIANGELVTNLQASLAGRSLGDLVSISEHSQGIVIKISKLGTSTLQFDREEDGKFAIFTLTSEKIAFAHKAFKDDVKTKLISVIEKTGGTVLES
jgi:hypothetical protein